MWNVVGMNVIHADLFFIDQIYVCEGKRCCIFVFCLDAWIDQSEPFPLWARKDINARDAMKERERRQTYKQKIITSINPGVALNNKFPKASISLSIHWLSEDAARRTR